MMPIHEKLEFSIFQTASMQFIHDATDIQQVIRDNFQTKLTDEVKHHSDQAKIINN